MENQLSRKEAVKILWNQGVLSWKLDSNQKELYKAYHESKNKVLVWLASRRLGKSHTLCVIAIEICLKKPNSVVKYVAPQTKMVRTIIRPLLRDILKDCPPELRPEYKTQEQLYRFPNGSEIQLAGTDNQNAENVRGGGAELCLVDEAGFCDDLDYIIKSILLPTTTTTRGKIILSSTPPRKPGHEFEDYIKKSEIEGTLIKKTIYDNPRLTIEDIEEMKREYGGEESVEWQREFLCQLAKDEELTVVPEFNEALAKEIVSEWIKPACYDSYVAMDVGGRDFTAVLFAYLDFRQGKIIIEDEICIRGRNMTTDVLVDMMRQKEASLWTKKPYLRIADNNNLILLNDLQTIYKISFIPTAKDNADAALQAVRTLLKQKKIIIHPRCTTLIRHLKNAIWNASRTSFARTANEGHFDALAALIYLCRNVQFYKNPYPYDYGMVKGDGIFYKEKMEDTKYSKFKDIFKTKKSVND